MAVSGWMIKIGEGLLVGLGASIAFAVFQGMQEATGELKVANEKLVKQDENNLEFKELIEVNAKDANALKAYIEATFAESNETIATLAEELEKLSKALAESESTSEEKKQSSYDWDNFKSNFEEQRKHKIPEITSASPWVKSDPNQEARFKSLEGSIAAQRALSRDHK